MRRAEFENWTNIVLGAWLFISPWIFLSAPAGQASAWNLWVVGALIFGVSIFALKDLKPWEEWINLVLGAWVILSPWLFGYATEMPLMWNSVIVGIGVVASAGFALPVALRHQH